MKFNPWLLCLSVSAICIISCKKDSGNTKSKALDGTWNFSSMHSSTVASNDYNDGGDDSKTVTYSTYDTRNNTGTVKFDGGTVTSTGLGYSVDTVLVGYFYDNNVLTDSTTEPFTLTVPASGSSSSYKLVGEDSISFTGSGLVGASSSGTASGGHYSIADNKLIITTSVVKDSVAHDGSATLTIHETADVNIFLVR